MFAVSIACRNLSITGLSVTVASFASRPSWLTRLATRLQGRGVDRTPHLSVSRDITNLMSIMRTDFAVLDALSAPAGKEDDRTKGQRYRDALAEAMRRQRPRRRAVACGGGDTAGQQRAADGASGHDRGGVARGGPADPDRGRREPLRRPAGTRDLAGDARRGPSRTGGRDHRRARRT